jgi:trehalose 6-phosphate phosphatase
MNDLATFAIGPNDALFLDFDGTLAELGPDPDAIHLPEATRRHLDSLATRLTGALALLSGRDLRDLVARTPSGVWRLGGHGLETLPPHQQSGPPPPPPPEALLAPLREVARLPGVRLELKGPVAALHYRAATEHGPACLAAADAAARLVPGHVTQAGKMVVEVKPASAHKGTALRRLMTEAPFAGRRPVMLGDDTTDEDAMWAALDLGGLAVKIGPGDSAAPLRSPDPAAVRAWLAREAQR